MLDATTRKINIFMHRKKKGRKKKEQNIFEGWFAFHWPQALFCDWSKSMKWTTHWDAGDDTVVV